jgi:hypothetical protein
MPKTAVNFHKMKKGLFQMRKNYPAYINSEQNTKPSRNNEMNQKFDTCALNNDTMFSAGRDSLNHTAQVRSLTSHLSMKNRVQKKLRSIRDTRRSTNNQSSNLFLTQTPEKPKKLKKKVDLARSLNLADTTMSMNGMGVYMNVIRES